MANYNLFDAASLAMVPTGIKDGKLYSVKPDDGSGDFTFSRGTNLAATRVNADGLIEKGRENLILQSNTFDNGAWTGNVTRTGGQNGYDGSSDAWLIENKANNAYLSQNNTTSGVVTKSIYAKAGNVGWIRLGVSNSPIISVYFDLSGAGAYYGSNFIDANIESVGNGWYRCSAAFLAVSMGGLQWYPADANNNLGETGDNVYIQDAQLERGLVSTDYIETTTAPVQAGITEDLPRIDYTDGCGSLLLEPGRTNSLPDSEYIANWAGANTTIVTNAAISPEGVQNASSVTFASGGYWYKSVSLSYSAGQSFSWSIYANTQDIVTRWGGSTPAGTDTLSIEDVGNGYYRQTITRVVSGSGTANFQPLMDAVFVGVGTTFYVYGAQLESGSYPTSYIPTYGTATSREKDSAITLSVPDLIGQTEGTFFIEYTRNSTAESSYFVLSQIAGTTAGSYQNSIYLFQINNGNFVSDGFVSNAAQFGFTKSGGLSLGNHKIAIVYKQNDFALYIDGVQIGTDTSGNLPSSFNYLTIGGGADVFGHRQSVKQALLYKTRLTNNELAALTRPYDTYQEWVDGEGLTWESKSCTVQNLVELQNL